MRRKFYSWLLNNYALPLFCRGINGMAPRPTVLVYWCLFPVRSFHAWLHNHEGYDPRLDCWYIHGARYSDEFFSTLNRAPNGTVWTLYKGEYSGFTIKPYHGP